MSAEEVQIIPEKISLRDGKDLCHEVVWEQSPDLLDALYQTKGTFRGVPWTGFEGGAVLIGLDVDGQFDQVTVALPPGQIDEQSELVEQMATIRDLADMIGVTLDSMMSGQPRKMLLDVVREQADRIRELEGDDR